MKKNIKGLILSVLLVAMAMVSLVGCGDSDKNTNQDNQGSGSTSQNSSESNKQENTTPMTKEEYESYLTERYDYYFDNDTVDAEYEIYDIYDDNFDYGVYDEFITGYTDFTNKERANLEAFKKDLETNVRKGTPEVDKLNDQVITAIDKAIVETDKYTETFAEKTKDYGTLAKDEVIKGLRDIGRIPHDARVELDKLVDDAKNTLGID